jgi:hypothetical protein
VAQSVKAWEKGGWFAYERFLVNGPLLSPAISWFRKPQTLQGQQSPLMPKHQRYRLRRHD